MNMTYTDPMIRWRLKETIDALGITRYALQKESGVAMNTIRSMYEGDTKRPDLEVLDSLIGTLERMTGKTFELGDLLEYQRGGGNG